MDWRSGLWDKNIFFKPSIQKGYSPFPEDLEGRRAIAELIIGVLSWIIVILLALPPGIIVGNISGKVLMDAPWIPVFR
jgi:hypothetical protein